MAAGREPQLLRELGVDVGLRFSRPGTGRLGRRLLIARWGRSLRRTRHGLLHGVRVSFRSLRLTLIPVFVVLSIWPMLKLRR